MKGHTMIKRLLSIASLVAAGTVAASGSALAHHAMAGAPMTTFSHGLLSGVGHPILGFDHLFFVALVGIASIYTGHRFTAPLAYVSAMLLGCLAMTYGFKLPMIEVVIGLSLVVLGFVVLSGRALSYQVALIGFAAAGLFHGSAFGESIVGQEGGAPMAVLIGYLIGLAATQYAIALLAGLAAEKIWHATKAESVQARIAGGLVAGVGLFMTLEQAEGLVFSALGIAA